MDKSSSALIQRLLEAEEEADSIVAKARENRQKKLKEADASAEEEMVAFRKAEQEKFTAEYNQKYGNEKDSTRDLDEQTKKENERVSKDYKANKEHVVKYLIETVSTVRPTLDDVQVSHLVRSIAPSS